MSSLSRCCQAPIHKEPTGKDDWYWPQCAQCKEPFKCDDEACECCYGIRVDD